MFGRIASYFSGTNTHSVPVVVQDPMEEKINLIKKNVLAIEKKGKYLSQDLKDKLSQFQEKDAQIQKRESNIKILTEKMGGYEGKLRILEKRIEASEGIDSEGIKTTFKKLESLKLESEIDLRSNEIERNNFIKHLFHMGEEIIKKEHTPTDIEILNQEVTDIKKKILKFDENKESLPIDTKLKLLKFHGTEVKIDTAKCSIEEYTNKIKEYNAKTRILNLRVEKNSKSDDINILKRQISIVESKKEQCETFIKLKNESIRIFTEELVVLGDEITK